MYLCIDKIHLQNCIYGTKVVYNADFEATKVLAKRFDICLVLLEHVYVFLFEKMCVHMKGECCENFS